MKRLFFPKSLILQILECMLCQKKTKIAVVRLRTVPVMVIAKRAMHITMEIHTVKSIPHSLLRNHWKNAFMAFFLMRRLQRYEMVSGFYYLISGKYLLPMLVCVKMSRL